MASESKLDVWRRKVRNGKRKQTEKIWRQKKKVWDRLKDTHKFQRWTEDQVQEFELEYGVDLEEELANILLAEINASKSKCVNQR